MNRWLCLLSLLCINLCICYEYLPEHSNNLPRSRKRESNVRYKKNIEKHRKRRDYEGDDKDLVAQIDVASFIKSPEDEAIDSEQIEYQYKKMNHGRDYGDYGGLVELNSVQKTDSNENDAYVDSESPSASAQNVYPNSVSYDKIARENYAQSYYNNLKLYSDSNNNLDSDNQNLGHNPQKKCALNNIKLPFFSHNKSESVKGKKEKKRKLYGFNKPIKEKAISKPIDENSPKHNLVRETESPYKYYKINKRSYIERLCPACKRKFFVDAGTGSEDKRRDILNRQHSTNINQPIFESNTNLENDEGFGNSDTYDTDSAFPNEEEDSLRGRRKRQDDNRNIERQRELEDLERRVDSVTIRGPTYTKVDPKV